MALNMKVIPKAILNASLIFMNICSFENNMPEKPSGLMPDLNISYSNLLSKATKFPPSTYSQT